MAYLSLNSEIRTVDGPHNKPTKVFYSEITCDPNYKKPCTNYDTALWKINGKVVKDYLGPTAAEPNLAPALPTKGVEFIMLTQIYGDSNPKHQWIDDIEIWDGIPQ
jgi:hypothetical protein